MFAFYPLVDITAKTMSEEYTPLHLAARFIPQKASSDHRELEGTASGAARVEADGENEESILNYLKGCKGVDVSLFLVLLKVF